MNKACPVHPGIVLDDILKDLSITQCNFAKMIGLSRKTVNELCSGKTRMTVDISIRVGKAMGNGETLWINLQNKYDLWQANNKNKSLYDSIEIIVMR